VLRLLLVRQFHQLLLHQPSRRLLTTRATRSAVEYRTTIEVHPIGSAMSREREHDRLHRLALAPNDRSEG
jgi:hypothetical protein